jgi:hypothetical protein
MERSSARAIAVAAVALAAAVFLAGGFPVVAPSRLHLRCESPRDAARPLDPARWFDRQHLRNDVEFAEEIGVRFGDSRRKAEGRDGEHLRQHECTNALLAGVALRHNVAIEQLVAMRGERPVAVDGLVLIGAGALFIWFARLAATRLAHRLADQHPLILRVSVMVLAAAAAGAGLVALILVAHILEIVRLWDGHMSYRTGRLPWERHFEWVLAAGFATFCVTAWSRRLLYFVLARRNDCGPETIL